MFRVLKKFYGFVYKYKFLFFAANFALVLNAIVINLIPVIIRRLLDSASYESNTVFYIILLFIVLFLDWSISIAVAHLTDVGVGKASMDAKLSVFRHIHNLDYKFHSEKSSGSLISIFKRGESAFFSLYFELNRFGLQNILDFLVMIAVFLIIYPKLALITIILLLVNIAMMKFTISRNIAARVNLNKAEDQISKITVDNMMAFDTVKYFANEKYEENRLSSQLVEWHRAFMRYVFSFRFIDFINGGLVHIGMFSIIAISYYDYSKGNIGVGTLGLSVSYALLIFPSFKEMVYRIREIAKNFEDLSKYMLILDEPILIKNNPTQDAKAKWKSLKKNDFGIEYSDVVFKYSNEDVINNISLKINPSESIAFVGRSGAGKTTMIRLLMRFYDPNSGSIKIGGIDIRDIDKSQLRKAISIVPQDPIMFNESIKFNISYGKVDASDEEIKSALQTANLWDFVDSLENKWDTIVGERGIKLSGGQRQRLAIARAFLEDSPIIVFDEATSSLDSESEKLIQEAFKKISEGKTTIVIAHRLSTIRNVDRIIVLEGGKIVESGSHRDLVDKEGGIYKHLIDLQKIGEMKE